MGESDQRRDPTTGEWIQKQCCVDNHLYHSRSPGLMKQEMDIQKFRVLNPKTYIVQATDGTIKRCMKGINHCGNEELDFPAYESVAVEGEPKFAQNRGFRCINGILYSYCLKKRALVRLCYKRRASEAFPDCTHQLTL